MNGTKKHKNIGCIFLAIAAIGALSGCVSYRNNESVALFDGGQNDKPFYISAMSIQAENRVELSNDLIVRRTLSIMQNNKIPNTIVPDKAAFNIAITIRSRKMNRGIDTVYDISGELKVTDKAESVLLLANVNTEKDLGIESSINQIDLISSLLSKLNENRQKLIGP